MRDHFGAAPHRDLAAIVETPRTSWRRRYGAWCASVQRLPSPNASLASFFNAAYADPFAIVSSFTGTLWIGNDGGGQDYMVEVAPRSSAVYLFGPGVGELKYLADSLDAFMTLNELLESWSAYEKAHDLDWGEIEDGAIDPETLDIPQIRAGMRRLAERVRLTGFDRSDMASDFDEILPGLTGVRPRAKPASPLVSNLHVRSYWAQMNLRIGPGYLVEQTFGVNGRRRAPRMPPRSDVPADQVYRLWHAFFTADDAVLDRVARECASSKAALARRTAELLLAVRDGTAPGELGLLIATREVVREASSKRAPPPCPQASPLRERDSNDGRALAAARRAAFASPNDAARWDALTFALYETEDWGGMLAAVDARLAIDARHAYPWLQRGIALAQLEHPNEALAALDRAIAFDRYGRDGAAAWMNKAAIYMELARPTEARAHLHRALRRRPDLRDAALADAALAPLLPRRGAR